MRNKHDTLQKQLLVIFEVKSCLIAAYELDAKTVFLFFEKKTHASLFIESRRIVLQPFVVFQIAEFDSPGILMANPNSVFSKLVQATELEAEDHYLIE